MLRIAHTADWHLWDRHKYSVDGSRLKEIEANLDKIVSSCIQHKVNVLVIAGDIFHNHNPSEFLMKIFSRVVMKAVRHGILVRVLIGNHDTNGLVSSLDSVETLAESLESYEPNGEYKKFCVFKDGFAKETIRKTTIFYVPWQTEMGAVIKEAKKSKESGHHNVLFTHASVVGGFSDTGFKLNKIPDKMDLRPSDLVGWDYVGLGDFHMQQRIGNPVFKKKNKVFYCGSPFKLNWGERDHKKCFLIVDSVGTEIKVQRVGLTDIDFIQVEINSEDYSAISGVDSIDGISIVGSFIKIFVEVGDDAKYFKAQFYEIRENMLKKGARDVMLSFIKKKSSSLNETESQDVLDLDFLSACDNQLVADEIKEDHKYYVEYIKCLQAKIAKK